MSSSIDRAINAAFVESLMSEAAKEGWWTDVLADPDLLVAVRGSYLNVYYRGQALFKVSWKSTGLQVSTHEKYVIDPSLEGQVPLLANGNFDLDILAERAFVRKYDIAALKKMKNAAKYYSSAEKTGCHIVALKNANVIDVEVAFPGTIVTTKGSKTKRAPRVDLASLEPLDDESVRLVFWEAKDFSNGQLFSGETAHGVVDQIADYKGYVADHRDEIERCYGAVAGNLCDIEKMGWKRPLSPLFEEVQTGRKKLTLGTEPKVGLIIFGFDQAQKDSAGWQTHLKRLQAATPVVARGDAKDIRL